MTAKTAALLSDPHPNTHIVLPYGDSGQIITALSHFVTEGMRRGESVVLLITDDHRSALTRHLAEAGLNPVRLQAEGRLLFLDAAGVIDCLFVGDMPNPGGFDAVVGSAIRHGIANAPMRKARLYGEMVDQLCATGRDEAAVRIEELWNTLEEAQYVPVLCSYSLNTLLPLRDGVRERLLAAHTHDLTVA